ncbi:unnamed protein product [Adineta steineri]|uniref:Uncharacterized protein n=2 Tax=Adineta steineri TaxID=433720 RepID=A0A819J668_9BILA|nr:unnamed protein product [Adineta steineri]CAF1054639.1 unnamed protein product [Adineta steineri]CAF3479998.1 unnamed protein product [Adineta steineri]CAF3923801.1 unnamed protein product [Adineta steineri]
MLSQGSSLYNPSKKQQQQPPLPPPQDSYPSYTAPQPVVYGEYPPQQTGLFGPYSPKGGNDNAQYQSEQANKQTPPYVDPNTAPGYEQTQIPFQGTASLSPSQIAKDEEQAAWGNFNGFGNKEIRRAFVRKVYLLLMLQLLVTFGIIAIFHFTPTVRAYVQSPGGRWAYWSSYGVFMVTYLALACCKNIGRRFPVNLILLSLLTLSMAYMMGMISAFYDIESVFLAVAITSFVCFGVTLFSFQTKFDFTSCIGILFVISLALIGFGIACIFTYSKIVYTLYAGLGAVAFSIFLAVDTQLIMGGKRHEINAEDHVFAAMMLYLDVVYIFMYILMLLGKRE